jgi:hypothetical protein
MHNRLREICGLGSAWPGGYSLGTSRSNQEFELPDCVAALQIAADRRSQLFYVDDLLLTPKTG